MKQFDSIGFDLDGTLWDSAGAVAPGWNQALEEMGLPNRVTADDIHGIMGLNIYDIAEKFFPDMEKDRAIAVIRRCCQLENDFILKNGGILYPDLEYTLQQLSKKYKLYIVSNCEEGYIEAFLGYHKEIKPYISDFTCPGYTGGLSKGKNIRILLERNHWENSIYVGDTLGDQKAAQEAGIPFVHACYGFGQADHPDYSIKTIRQLLKIFE
jgi:phosphoglycolate phosphatase